MSELPAHLEYDFMMESYHSPENIVAACDIYDQLQAGTFYDRQGQANTKILGEDIKPMRAE